MALHAFHIAWMGRTVNRKTGQTLNTVVTSVAQDDKLSSHPYRTLPASEMSAGLSEGPSWGSESKTRLTVDSLPSLRH